MKIELIETCGWRAATKALRLPFSKDPKSAGVSDIYFSSEVHVDPETLLKDRVNVLHYETSIAVHSEDLRLWQVLNKKGDSHSKALRGIMVYLDIEAPIYWWCEMETYQMGRTRLSSASTMHTDARGLTGEELVRVKAEMPMGKELRKIDCCSYQMLRNVVKQRSNHRLPEWHKFIQFIHTLPYAEELIFANNEVDKY